MFFRIELQTKNGLMLSDENGHSVIRTYHDCRCDGVHFGFRNAILGFIGRWCDGGPEMVQFHLHHPERHGNPAIVYRPNRPNKILIGGCQEVNFANLEAIEKAWPTGLNCLKATLEMATHLLNERGAVLKAA